MRYPVLLCALLLAHPLLITALACDDPIDECADELEQSIDLVADEQPSNPPPNLVEEIENYMPEPEQNPENEEPDQPEDEQPQVGDIVAAESIPDRSVYLMNAGEQPLMALLLRVGDLELSELDTPEFNEWRATKCADYCAEHPEVDPAVMICEYTFSVG